MHSASAPPEGSAWIHQVKYDGFRCIMQYDNQRLQLWSRHGTNCIRQFSEFQSLQFPKAVLLDGEMIVEKSGWSDFEAVMKRLLAANPSTIQKLTKTDYAHFIAFDVLKVGTDNIMSKPLDTRLSILNAIVKPNEHISICESFDLGGALFDSTLKRGWEGVVSKRRTSHYVAGTRSHDWLKAKHYKCDVMTAIAVRQQDYELLVTRNGGTPSVVQFVPPSVRHEIRLRMSVIPSTERWIHLDPPLMVEVQYVTVTKSGWLRDAKVIRVLPELEGPS